MKKQIRSPKVAIVMGSQTDYKILQEAQFCLQEFGIEPLVQIISAHRTPEKMYDFATAAADKGIVVIIAGAGGAAHLPGMIASLTTVPVIGVPVTIGKLKGLDALLSIAQMPKGVPVASVAIDNAWNAGLLAVQILAMASPDGQEKVNLQKKLLAFKKAQKTKVNKMNAALQKQIKNLLVVGLVTLGFSHWAKADQSIYKAVPHGLPEQVLIQAEDFSNQGNVAEGWKTLGNSGDTYAAIAAKVMSPKPTDSSRFYSNLIRGHWMRVVGKNLYEKNFDDFARQHFRQYVAIIKHGFWPNSDEILGSYLQAARDHQLPEIIVFDAAWELSIFNSMKSWQSLNKLPNYRIVKQSKIVLNSSKEKATDLVTRDLFFAYQLESH